MMTVMNLQQLRYLVALADERNFTRAAARCWVSQQAFSKAIAQLEPQLNATLVVPRPRERRDGIDPGWEGFFTLSAERNGDEPERRGTATGSLEELLWSISLDRLFLTVPQHLALSQVATA